MKWIKTNPVFLKDIWSSFDPSQPLLFHKFGLFAGHLVMIWPFATTSVSQIFVSLKDIWSIFDPSQTLLLHKCGLFEGHLVNIWPLANTSVSQIWSLWRTFGHDLTLSHHFCFTYLVSLKDIWTWFDPLPPLLLHKFRLFEGHLDLIWPFATTSAS